MTRLIRSPLALGCGVLLAFLALCGIARAGQAALPVEPKTTVAHLRAGDVKAAALLAAGAARSETFRGLVDAIEHSDLIVYVETRPLRLPGQLQLLAATPVCRHLRVSVRIPGLDTDLIAWLAHELRHAVELAGAPEVTDQASLRRFYQRIGAGGRHDDKVESSAAQETWTKVLCEIRDSK